MLGTIPFLIKLIEFPFDDKLSSIMYKSLLLKTYYEDKYANQSFISGFLISDRPMDSKL